MALFGELFLRRVVSGGAHVGSLRSVVSAVMKRREEQDGALETLHYQKTCRPSPGGTQSGPDFCPSGLQMPPQLGLVKGLAGLVSPLHLSQAVNRIPYFNPRIKYAAFWLSQKQN